MTQYPSYGYNSGTTTFPNMAQNISASQVTIVIFRSNTHTQFFLSNANIISHFLVFSLPQKLDYSAYSSSLYANDRVPLQYSGYYSVPGYHGPSASFNIGNINFGNSLITNLFGFCFNEKYRKFYVFPHLVSIIVFLLIITPNNRN